MLQHAQLVQLKLRNSTQFCRRRNIRHTEKKLEFGN